MITGDIPRRAAWGALAFVAAVYLHNTLPHLTMLPRVNVDEPWLMERAYQVMTTGVPSQPMLRLTEPYYLQPGYGYLYAPWFAMFGVGMFEARLLSVLLGLGVVLCVFGIGRRLTGVDAGLAAAAFLAADSNFLGNVRTSRTDIPSVFFAAAALWCFVRARDSRRRTWDFLSGACAGLAMLCHGNAYWAVVILIGWYLAVFGRSVLRSGSAAMFALGGLVTFGPYVAIVIARWSQVSIQIGNFAAGRAPSFSVAAILQHAGAELERYRGWYFGLVTNSVPNPLLWAFEIATVAGLVIVLWRAVTWRADARQGYVLLAILSVGTAAIFAGFIPNKAHVYMPNLLLGFSLAAGTFVAAVARAAAALIPAPNGFERLGRALPVLVVLAYSATSLAYYEKWYASQQRSELEPFESTERSIHALVPPGPKDIFTSPNFWVALHAQPGVRVLSYTGATPALAAGHRYRLPAVGEDRPIYLLIDESEWRAVVTDERLGYTEEWRTAWTRYVTEQCVLRGVVYGTSFGNLASYECANDRRPAMDGPPVIVGSGERFELGTPVWAPRPEEIARLPRYEDERRSPGSPPPEIALEGDAVRISGSGWPGIATELNVTAGERYLLRFDADGADPGDLVYLGRWDSPEVRSLAGTSSAGIFAPLAKTPWFPGDRAFVATAGRVWLRVYSEAPSADFRLRSLQLIPLVKVAR